MKITLENSLMEMYTQQLRRLQDLEQEMMRSVSHMLYSTEQETPSWETSSEELLKMVEKLEITTLEACLLMQGWSERLNAQLKEAAYPALINVKFRSGTDILH